MKKKTVKVSGKANVKVELLRSAAYGARKAMKEGQSLHTVIERSRKELEDRRSRLDQKAREAADAHE